jgi:hypothetical protein
MSNYQDLLEIASRSGNRIVVNLPRLFAPENAIISKYLGNDSLNRISGNYSGGYINTFLHVVTFVNSIFPDSHWQSAFQNGKHYINIYRNERIVGEINEMQKKKISAFDLEIHNNLGILNYLEGGTLIYYSTNDSIIQIENTRGHFQRNVYDYIAVSGWHNAVKRAGLEHILPSISTFLELDPRA